MVDNKIRYLALENALKYKGKANPGAVIGSILALEPGLKKDMKSLSKKIQGIIKEVNSMSAEEQEKALSRLPKLERPEKEEKKGLPELPDAVKGKVVTRIPPEPSKYTHLGHALSFLINYTYAKKYDGKCILRFEDTNPEKSTQEFVDSTLDDLNYLGIKPDKVIYVSDELPMFYEMAEKLIMKKKAYVCHCSRDEMKKNRDEGRRCCLDKSDAKENTAEWKKMLTGKYEEGEATLRLAGDMGSKNHVMRDPVIFRINKAEHYRQKKKYCVWPLYDFENSISDSVNGITHILRSSEFGSMRIELQDYIKDLLGLKKQVVVQYGRFNIKGATTKGREIRELIKEGKVSGWDDPSLVTIKALRRRGIVNETYIELMNQMRLSSNTAKNIDWSMISSINRAILDKDVNRYFFVENPVEIKISGAPEQQVELKLHPDFPERGSRRFTAGESFYVAKEDYEKFREGKLIRLMDCLNFEITGKKYKFHSKSVEEYRKNGSAIIHWLPKEEELANVEIRMPDNEIKKGLAEPSVKNLKAGEIVQFARFGFCRLDKKEKNKLVFWFTNR